MYNARLNWSPGCFAYRGSDSVITTANAALVTFNALFYDNDAMIPSPSTDIAINSSGIYAVTANIEWAVNGTGWRQLAIIHRANAVDTIRAAQVTNASATANIQMNCAIILSCDKGESIRVQVQQTSGGNLTLNATGYSPIVMVQRISPTQTGKE
jgi:hypothetical protein